MPSALEVDRLEFAILAERAELNRIPMVTSFSHYGSPIEDVSGEFAAAGQRCVERGLLDRGGQINGDVLDLIAVYAHPSVEYDLRFSAEQGAELRAAVSRSGETAIRTVITDDRISVQRVRSSETVSSLITALPERGPARIRPPLSVDLVEIRAVMAGVEQRGEENPAAIERGLRDRGVNVASYRKMTNILDGPRLGLGEIGVTVWGARGKEYRGGQTIRIIDLASGRVAIYNSGSQRMLAGADTGTFERVLGGLTKETQRRSQE